MNAIWKYLRFDLAQRGRELNDKSTEVLINLDPDSGLEAIEGRAG